MLLQNWIEALIHDDVILLIKISSLHGYQARGYDVHVCLHMLLYIVRKLELDEHTHTNVIYIRTCTGWCFMYILRSMACRVVYVCNVILNFPVIILYSAGMYACMSQLPSVKLHVADSWCAKDQLARLNIPVHTCWQWWQLMAIYIY